VPEYDYSRDHIRNTDPVIQPLPLPVEMQLLMVASTAHITKADGDKLNSENPPLPVVATREFGAFVWTGGSKEAFDPDMLAEMRQNWSNAFVSLVLLAHNLGAGYLSLDNAGPIYEFIPTFEW